MQKAPPPHLQQQQPAARVSPPQVIQQQQPAEVVPKQVQEAADAAPKKLKPNELNHDLFAIMPPRGQGRRLPDKTWVLPFRSPAWKAECQGPQIIRHLGMTRSSSKKGRVPITPDHPLPGYQETQHGGKTKNDDRDAAAISEEPPTKKPSQAGSSGSAAPAAGERQSATFEQFQAYQQQRAKGARALARASARARASPSSPLAKASSQRWSERAGKVARLPRTSRKISRPQQEFGWIKVKLRRGRMKPRWRWRRGHTIWSQKRMLP